MSAGADELWGGKLRGAILRRAAHIVFLRIQVKHAQGSDLMRDPLHGNRPGPPRSSSGHHPFAHNGDARPRTLARLGEPSGDQHDQWIPQFFLRYVHAGLNLREAIDTQPGTRSTRLVLLAAHGTTRCFGRRRNRVPSVTVEELRRRGHHAEIGPDWSEGRLVAAAPYRLC